MRLPVSYDLGDYREFGIKYKGENEYHLGHDFNVKLGCEVIAIANGQIMDIREANGFGGWDPKKKGWYIWIQHLNVYALYGHVKPLDNLKAGDLVSEGQVIGHVHDYLRSGKHLPHLHFGIWNGLDNPGTDLGYDSELSKWIDPKKYILENKS